jgi:two-component system, chemotaxis family, protein-glutamate methylesterase/glutaminase
MAQQREIIVIGGSAGGVEAISTLLRQLPPGIPAAVFVVCHQMPDSKGYLADMLNTGGPLLAKCAEDGEEIHHGVVYVAPPDRHLIVKKEALRVVRGPRENRWRPAIDPLFRSAAVAYGPRVIGVLLSGMLDDGTAGLMAIKRCGGVAVVQDPEDAPYPDMPRNALANVEVDHRLAVPEMGPVIEKLIAETVLTKGPAPRDLEIETAISESGFSDENLTQQLGELSSVSCPECGGPLWRQDAANTSRYRCRVGHSYGAESMLSAEGEALEASLWAAVRLFDQRANLLTTMSGKDREGQHTRMEEHHRTLANQAREHAKLLRRLIIGQRD